MGNTGIGKPTMKRTSIFQTSSTLGPWTLRSLQTSGTRHYNLLPAAYCLLALLAILSPARAQTQVDITYNKDTGGGGTLVTETFLGAFCRVPLALETVRTNIAGAFYI